MFTEAYDQFVDQSNLMTGGDSYGRLIYDLLALGGEAGEASNILKKTWRKGYGELSPNDANKIMLELGDVIWYVTAAAHELGVPLDRIMKLNQQKLIERKEKNEDLRGRELLRPASNPGGD